MVRRIFMGLALVFAIALLAWPMPGAAQDPSVPVRIGVLAHRGAEVARRQWLPHADYLNRALKPLTFIVEPMSYGELTEAVRQRRIQFAITNTGHYTELELTGDLTRLATRLMDGPEGALDRFGGTVITQAGRDDIHSYRDIAAKRLLIPDRSSFGGWLAHLMEARIEGVQDFEALPASITETGNHEAIVAAILEGTADVGFVRSDLIEAMASTGRIDSTALAVVSPRVEKGYPYRLSTRLYPEWPFARVTGTPEDLARDVLVALLHMPAGNAAARAAEIGGWTVPLSYKAVDDLFRTLRIGPYADLEFALKDVAARYSHVIAITVMVVIVLLSGAMVVVLRSKGELEAEVARRAEAERSLRLLDAAVEQGPAAVMITGTDRRVLYVNDAFCRLTGYGRDEMQGVHVKELRATDVVPDSVYREVDAAIDAGKTWTGDLCSRRKDGSLLWERAVVSPVFDEAGTIVNYLAIKQDISLQRSYEAALNRAANYDALTGLPNRALARDRLERLFVEGESVALLHMAVDNLSRINDSLGHGAGDAVIMALAERFQRTCLPSDTVARLGGDEFTVFRPNPRDPSEASVLAAALLAAAAEPIMVTGVEVRVTVRVGIATGPQDGATVLELEKAAYNAATRAKESGGNTIRHFQQAMDSESRWRIEAEHGLRQALASDGFELYLQPYVAAQSGLFVGAEALLRWRRPGEGFVSPARFIPVAERSGLIRDIDRWVIDAAARAAAELREELGAHYPVAVNISPVDLLDNSIVDYTIAVMQRYGLPPEALEVEVTEGVFLADEHSAGEALRAFDAAGISIAIDDFGTGYSSLGYLRRYPVKKLKIDRTFVSGVDGDPKLIGLANAISSMAGHLGLKVTAEGVERHEEWQTLRAAGCDYIQGYLFARPMTLPEVKRLVKAPSLQF